jgi:hypothetical protein
MKRKLGSLTEEVLAGLNRVNGQANDGFLGRTAMPMRDRLTLIYHHLANLTHKVAL